MKHVAVFTSGGDAPGMNAAVRAVVRTAIAKGLKITGLIGGYQGMIENHYVEMNLRSVANIIQRGGTVLKTGRSSDFMKPEFRTKAAQNLKALEIEGLICIGGDGSFRGAMSLEDEHGIPTIGIPGTIDNDIYGTDNTIGFDTAVNTALQAIDRIRDTAASHDRLFIVEVMGRNCGYIACYAGLAGGAEEIFTPDIPIPLDKVVDRIKAASVAGKTSSILVTAEGQKPGRAYDLAEQMRKRSGLEAKVCIIGHQQRGGSPTASDRILASRMGAFAVESLLSGASQSMVASEGQSLKLVPFKDSLRKEKSSPKDFLLLSQILAQ